MIKMGILAAFFCTIILYFLSAGCYFVQSKSASKTLGVLATTLAGLGLLANTLVLLLRIMLTGGAIFKQCGISCALVLAVYFFTCCLSGNIKPSRPDL
jgi:hypothetical protein